MKKYFSALIITAFATAFAYGQVEIDNANNVGIGISTPTQKLDVNGNLRVRTILGDNSLTQILVQDPIGNVHFRDVATISNWSKVGDSLFSDPLCLVGIGTAQPLQPLHVVGQSRFQIGNALLDIWPIPGLLGIGGINLIFNKDNICIGRFGWEEKILPPPFPPLPDPVFKLFPRTSSNPLQAPGLEVATFGNAGLGLEGTRLMLCPSPVGPFPLWENPRIDLKISNEIELQPGGTDGLVVSNIGSSGQDGVSLSLTEPVIPVEIISLDLVSSAPFPIVRHGTNKLITQYEYDGLNRLVRRTYADTTGSSTAFPHVYEYDGLNNRIRETGPPLRIFELDSLITTYEYDPLNRLIRHTTQDQSTSTIAPPWVREYDAIGRIVRCTGPRTLEYTSSQLRHTSLFEPTTRTITETWDDLLIPGFTQTQEFDFLLDQMRLIAGQVRVIGDLYVEGVPATTHQIIGNLNVQGNVTKFGGTFKIDHPQDPFNKYLSHSFVESPDMMNIYNGNVTTDEQGRATVTMPDYFTVLNMDFRYQLTTIGQQAQAWIAEEVNGNTFKISTDKANVKVSWQVTGIRNDTYAKENRVQVEVDKEEAMKGKLLYEPKLELGLNK